MTTESLPHEFAELIARARQTQALAYAPYSQFRVGAAVRARSGEVFVGCNVENATYGATLCAERCAVAGMVAKGFRELSAVAVFTESDPPAMPCGICRQTLMEFGTAETIVIAASPASVRSFSLGVLFPEPFVLEQ